MAQSPAEATTSRNRRKLSRSGTSRNLLSGFLSVMTGLLTLLALIPLFSVLFMLAWQGGGKIVQSGWSLFTQLPPAAGMEGGGIGNAVVGTLVMVGIASLLSVPFGVLGGIYLAEFGPDSRLATIVRFCAKVLTGLPSVLAGLVAYAAVVLPTGTFSAPAGGVALAILMLPTILLTAESVIKSVPSRMREAAIGMGCTPTQAVLGIILPTALPGVMTGVMLAVARAAGETAPLLFTALASDYWMSSSRLLEPTASLAYLIYDFSASPFPNQLEMAWAASLVLVFFVLLTNIVAQIYSARHHS
jgi:phosphate transport system permease protein